MHPTRYKIEISASGRGWMEEDEDGRWVKFEDFQRLVAFAETAARRLHDEHDDLKRFAEGFIDPTPCTCDGCRAARAILEAREETINA